MAANPRIDSTVETSQCNFEITRVFDAPRELVWKAWTNADLVAKWWGAKGYTNPRCEWDARPNGAIHIEMRALDGVVYPMKGGFQEVVEPERLVFRIVFTASAFDEHGSPLFDITYTVTFADHPGQDRRDKVRRRTQTDVTLQARVTITSAHAPQYMKGMEIGWNECLDRLGDCIAPTVASAIATISGDREIVCTRVFDAPRELVWEMFTDPRHITHWWGPRGFSTTTEEMELMPGGTWRHVMHGPDGRDYHSVIQYLEVVKPEKLVFRHTPETGTEPTNHQTSVLFSPAGDRTRIDFRMTFESAAALEYIAKTYGAVEGLTQTLGRLAEYLVLHGAEDCRTRE